MKSLPLFELSIRHSYYGDDCCPDFVLAPDPATCRLLQNHRCLPKSRPDGIEVFVEVADDNTPLIPLPDHAPFSLQLRLQNMDFTLFTDMGQTRITADGAGDSTCSLTYPAAGRFRSGVFAQADITLARFQPGSVPARFAIEFAAKAFHWSYYLVTDLCDSGAGFAVVDAAPTPALQWTAPTPPLPADPVAAVLAERYPAMQCWRFVSTAPVPCRQEARKQLELRLGAHSLLEDLPNPSPGNYARICVDTNGKLTDSLYQVLSYISDRSLTKGL